MTDLPTGVSAAPPWLPVTRARSPGVMVDAERIAMMKRQAFTITGHSPPGPSAGR